MRKIILASSSPTRKNLMEKLGIPFEVEHSRYEEDLTLKLPPKVLVQKMALGKAEVVAKNHKNAVIIGADIILLYKDEILGKPHTSETARKTLRLLSGKKSVAITGVAIIDTKTKKKRMRAITTDIFFRKLTSQEIEWYVNTGEPLDKAGAFAILERGMIFVEKINGDLTNVAGLPIPTLIKELRRMNIEVLPAK